MLHYNDEVRKYLDNDDQCLDLLRDMFTDVVDACTDVLKERDITLILGDLGLYDDDVELVANVQDSVDGGYNLVYGEFYGAGKIWLRTNREQLLAKSAR